MTAQCDPWQVRRPDADDEIKVENAKDWRLKEAVPQERPARGVSAQFVVTKHHAYCVIAVRGQALLIKLGGQTNGSHESMYTDRFPEKARPPLLPLTLPLPAPLLAPLSTARTPRTHTYRCPPPPPPTHIPPTPPGERRLPLALRPRPASSPFGVRVRSPDFSD